MDFTITVSEIKELFSLIKEEPAKLFEMMESGIQKQVGKYLSKLMDMELTAYLGRKPYQREKENTVGNNSLKRISADNAATSKNYRNGSYSRKFFIKRIGEVETKVPRDRNNEYHTKVLPKAARYDKRLSNDLYAMFLSGISTRTLSALSSKLIGRKVSPSEISSVSKEFAASIEKWRTRDLSQENIKYLYIDGVNFPMRITNSIENTPILAIIGVNEKGFKKVILLQRGDKESASTWREVFKDLKKRGLDYSNIQLGIMDGLPGLEKVFKEEFPNAVVQRCQVHVARNVISKVPQKHKKEVADDLRTIFYASSKDKAKTFYKVRVKASLACSFKIKYEKERFNAQAYAEQFPSAFKSLSNSIDSCLSFFNTPAATKAFGFCNPSACVSEEEWISLRTTNVIERLNKVRVKAILACSFKRRTKPMEILAGEASSYNLLSFIAYKMELSWASTPVGTVHQPKTSEAHRCHFIKFTQSS